MPKVLIVSGTDIRAELAPTVLGRREVEWVLAPDPEAGFEKARSEQPKLVIVALNELGHTEAFLRRIRQDEATRQVGLVVLSAALRPQDEEALRQAGANAVLSGRADPFLWNEALDTLLRVPWRRQVRISVRFWVWFHFSDDDQPIQGRALNLSLHGMLLETSEPVDIGAKIEAQFQLHDSARRITVIGQVVRAAGAADGQWRYGVQFTSLHGDDRDRLRAFVEPRP
jgi:CheY-like chemotaxis protein